MGTFWTAPLEVVMTSINSRLVEICQHDGPGYKPLVYFEGWRVAILNDDEKFKRENTRFLERHNLTDEVFVLLTGKCVLFIGDGGDSAPGCITCLPMEANRIYNVKKGVWHNLETATGTAVLIVENADTAKTNSSYMPVTPDMLPLS
jgi:hypothetical protein